MSIAADTFNRVLHSLWERLAHACPSCGHPTRSPVCTACVAASAGIAGLQRLTPSTQRDTDQLASLWHLGRYFHPCAPRPTPLAELLLRFKYGRDREAGHALRKCFGQAWAPSPERFDFVVPVPLHPHKLRTRGYNQAAWLALGAARSMRLRVKPSALTRLVDSEPQAGASAPARRALHGAFVARSPAIRDASVLVIDDVYTTGATIRDAARALREAGASSIAAGVLLIAGSEPLRDE